MDELKGEAFSSNVSESRGTVAQESAKEDKVEEEGGSNGDDIMVEVLGSHVYVDGICTTDGGGARGNSLNDEVVGGQDAHIAASRGEDGSRTLDGEGEELVSGGDGDAEMLRCMQENKVKKNWDHDEGDQLGGKGVPVINFAKDKKEDTVANSASGQPTESTVEDQLANEVQSDKMDQLQIDKQGLSSGQELVEIERHGASSEIHHTRFSNSEMVDLFSEGSETQLTTEATLHSDTANGLSIEEGTEFEEMLSNDQNVNLHRGQEVQVDEASIEMVTDGTENSGYPFSDSGDVDMQNNDGLSENSDCKELVERDRQEISGDMDVTCSHSGGQDAVIGNDPHDHNAGQIANGDQEQDNHAEEQSKKQTALTPDSPLELHYVKYQLPPEDGEFCISDLVWGKVRSHPWWPGQIFDPSDASDMAMRHHKKDSFLVAYFGDRTFAWNDASLLKPFRVHFSAAEKQNKSETFQNAVNCALEEVFRRVELGLACSCSPKDIHDKNKFQVVENTGIRQESSVQDVSDRFFTAVSFEPDNLLKYIKGLAQFPCGEADKLDIAIAKAQLSALYCLRGYHPLPEFRSGRGLVEADTSIAKYEERIHSDNITDYPSPMDLDDEQVSSSRRNSDPQRGSYHKRKHDLKGGLYPSKRERSLSELVGEGFDSLDTDGSDGKLEHMLASPSSSKKHKAVDPFPEEAVEEGRRIISLAKVSHTPQPPKPSFKIGECISRVASQMTGSPSVLKGPGDRLQKLNGVNVDVADSIDFPSETYEDAIRKFSSSDQLLSELLSAASDPMKDFSFLNVVISFFFDFRNSLVLDHIPADKGGKRKRSSNSVIGSAETFEFEDMSDTYWTDRIVQNGSEEQLAHGNGREQYQIVSVELEKPVQRGRKSKKRYADVNHDAAGQKPPGYVNERAPAELVMTFSELNSVPSEAKLSKMFRHFGPLKESETEVDWETSRARVVFRRCSDAEVALNSAEKFNIFGAAVVKYQLNYSISESFKASLYAPALPEETQIVTQSLDEHTPLFGSAHGDHNQLIVSTLGEDASFMVSSLADESLPLPSSFGEENSYMTMTLAEETSNVTAHAGEGTFTITTTTHMETLAAGISENGTVGRQILPYEQISDTNMGEQTARGSITADVETRPGSNYFNEPTSTVCTSICELPCTDAAATVGEMSTMPTSASEQTFTITTSTREEQLNCSMTSGMEESTDARTVSEQTFTITTCTREEQLNCSMTSGMEESTDARTVIEQTLLNREMPGEQASNISANLGEEASDMDASFGQESGPSSLSEGTSNADTTLGKVDLETSTDVQEETSNVPVSSGQEYSAGRTTSWVEVLTDVSGLGDNSDTEVKTTDKTLPLGAPQDEESVGVTVSLVREGTSVTSGEEPSAVNVISAGEEISAMSLVSGKKVSSVPDSGEETSVVPVSSAVKTSVVIETPIEEPSAATMVSGNETLTVIATMDEDRSAVPVTSGQETPAVPAIMGEDLSVTPLTSCKETSAVNGEDLSAATMATGEETSAVPATTTEDHSATPMESGQETSEVPPTTGEDLSASLVASGEETSAVPTTLEILAATPMASVEETSAGPATTVEDLAAALYASGEETSAIPATMVEDLAAAPNASSEETSAVPTPMVEDLAAAPNASGEETSAVHTPMVEDLAAAPNASGEETLAVPATSSEDLSAVHMLTDDKTSAVFVGTREETPAASVLSGEERSAVGEDLSAVPMVTDNETAASSMVCAEETSAIPAIVCEDLSVVPMLTDDETSIVAVNSGVEITTAGRVSGEETSAAPLTTSEDPSTVPVGSGGTLAAPVVSGEETTVVPVASGVETSASARVFGKETSAVPLTTSEDPSTVLVGPGETPAAPAVSGEETSASARVSGEETSAVPLTTSEDPSTVPVWSGETPAAPVFSGEETTVVPVASGEETSADSSKQPLIVSVITGEETSSVVVAAGEAASTVTATNDGETSAVPSTSSGEQLTTVSDRGDQTIGTKAEETSLFSATVTEETVTVDMTSMVNPSSAEGISTIATSTGDGASSPLSTLGQATSAVITSVKETSSTVAMTLDEASSTVTAVSDMENASAGTTQLEEYA